MENKIRKAIKDQIIKLKEQLGPRMKSPRPTGPSDPRSSKDIEFDNAQSMSRLTPDDKDKLEKIKQMMDKEKSQKEDYKPSHRAYNVIDKSNNDKIVAKELSRDKALELAHTNKDYMISATDRLAKEGSCGHGPNGVPGNTPGETQGANADDRTKSIIKKLIQKEIKKLSEKEGVPHYTKDGKEWTGPTHKMPNGKLMTQDPHREDSEELFHKEDLK